VVAANRRNSHLVPGGYIEQGEAGVEPRCDDGTLKPDSILYRWHDFAVSMESTLKKPLNVTETMKESIIEAGFVDVVETRFKMPLGPWTSDPRMKELGRWYRNYWETGMEGWSMAPGTRHLGVGCKSLFVTRAVSNLFLYTVEV
jgi:hypothetical protein